MAEEPIPEEAAEAEDPSEAARKAAAEAVELLKKEAAEKAAAEKAKKFTWHLSLEEQTLIKQLNNNHTEDGT